MTITQERRHRLITIPEIHKQPHHRKLLALQLINRGADAALLLFWINLITASYSHFPRHCVMQEVMHYLETYPQFEDDIVSWFLTFEDLTQSSHGKA